MNNRSNKKSLNGQIFNEKMTSYEKNCVKALLFDSISIDNYHISLLHAEITVGNKKHIILNELAKELNPCLKKNLI